MVCDRDRRSAGLVRDPNGAQSRWLGLGHQSRPGKAFAAAPVWVRYRAHLPAPFSLSTPGGMAALNTEVTRQAAMVAYIDDFKLLMLIALASLPMLLLLREARRPPPPAASAAADD